MWDKPGEVVALEKTFCFGYKGGGVSRTAKWRGRRGGGAGNKRGKQTWVWDSVRPWGRSEADRERGGEAEVRREGRRRGSMKKKGREHRSQGRSRANRSSEKKGEREGTRGRW